MIGLAKRAMGVCLPQLAGGLQSFLSVHQFGHDRDDKAYVLQVGLPLQGRSCDEFRLICRFCCSPHIRSYQIVTYVAKVVSITFAMSASVTLCADIIPDKIESWLA